ncbi:hypothetical protein N7530_012308 [Penicillium desertorum]|uniref:Uncharacterized protein n=1 Tax=Penicillium desertorum TaxID=1303715 RepID=A0A9X0BGL9_9EURO|nr:hypothetical protein N7530_012308 [Penicillium desertorum]
MICFTRLWLIRLISFVGGWPDRNISFYAPTVTTPRLSLSLPVLRERISKLLADLDQKHSDSSLRLTEIVNLANTRQVPTGEATLSLSHLPDRPYVSTRQNTIVFPFYRDDALTSQASLVSGWLAGAKTNGTLPSNNLSESSCPVATPDLIQEDLQIVITTEPSLVNPLRRDADDLVRRVNRSIVSSDRVLPSGDILLQVDSLQDVHLLHQREVWCKVFGGQWPVPGNAEIVRIGWLITKRKMEETRPQYANLVVELWSNSTQLKQRIVRSARACPYMANCTIAGTFMAVIAYSSASTANITLLGKAQQPLRPLAFN